MLQLTLDWITVVVIFAGALLFGFDQAKLILRRASSFDRWECWFISVIVVPIRFSLCAAILGCAAWELGLLV